ncbi:restriction endonuclease [Bacillus australimaris]|uniref:restriction endonuclease n=1 Tax=Bacillus australimaris TaxID=1326968 RepID=UPI0039B4E348
MGNVIVINRLIKEGKMTLEKWLNLVLSNNDEKVLPNNCFPSDVFLNEYINKIDDYSLIEFNSLLRILLVHSGNYGIDEDIYDQYDEELFKEYPTEYYRRLIETGYAYEGITWILDILDNFPRKALEVLEAYQNAHCITLPESAMNGLYDAQVLIRARYLENDYNVDTLLNLSPREFEYLIAKLYKCLGYNVYVTPQSNDGGKDVIAINEKISRRETLFIECKRHNKNVSIDKARALVGSIVDKKATKGVLISARGFTKGTIQFAKENPNVELIGGQELLEFLDEHLGKNWFDFIPKYVKEINEEQNLII